MNKIGITHESLIGGTGVLATISLSGYNQFIAAATGTATFLFMAHRCWREWRKEK